MSGAAVPPTMAAARAHAGERHLRLEDVSVPQPGPGEALVRVESAGMTRGLLAMWWFTPMIPLPATLGHDIAGTVAQVGDGVTGFAPGDRVWVSTALVCGECAACLAGADNMCAALGVMGYALYGEAGRARHQRYRDGGFAEYVLAPAANLNPLPAEVPMDVAGKLGTIAGGLRALLTLQPSPGDTLVVTAAGGATGAAAARLAPLLGVSRVIAVARSREGLERLAGAQPGPLEALATDELDEGWETSERLSQLLRQLAGGDGPTLLLDLMPAGAEVTMEAIRSLAPGGRAVLMGGNVQRLTLSYLDVMRNQWRIGGVRGHRRADEVAVARLLASGLLRVGDLLTHRVPLGSVNEAVEAVGNRAGRPGMVVVTPGARV